MTRDHADFHTYILRPAYPPSDSRKSAVSLDILTTPSMLARYHI